MHQASKKFIDANNCLPSYVNIAGRQNHATIFSLTTTALLNIKAHLSTSIVLKTLVTLKIH